MHNQFPGYGGMPIMNLPFGHLNNMGSNINNMASNQFVPQ